MSIIHVILLAQAASATVQSPPDIGHWLPLPTQPLVVPSPPPRPQGHPPVPNGEPAKWILAEDYPSIALRQNWKGDTGFRLTIGTTGLVIKCDVTHSSGYVVLDKATCDNVTRRASFQPAKDFQGKPVMGFYSNRVRWDLPEDINPFAEADGTYSAIKITWSFFIEPDGSTSNCVVSDGHTALQLAEPGSPCGPEMYYKPFTDANGKPVRKRVFYRMEAGFDPAPKR